MPYIIKHMNNSADLVTLWQKLVYESTNKLIINTQVYPFLSDIEEYDTIPTPSNVFSFISTRSPVSTTTHWVVLVLCPNFIHWTNMYECPNDQWGNA